jgi:hypothetical protein
MDILTLGKMNAMARNTDLALELMANHLYESQQEICDFQATNIDALDIAVADGLQELGVEGGKFISEQVELPFVCHTSHDSVSNGGCHLAWTVPINTKAIKIELQGGGGGGPPSQCCMIGRGGGTGAYADKMLYSSDYTGSDFVNGDTYHFCSGGTTPCSCCTCCTGLYACGWCGCPSYATGPGLSGFCANGGSSGWNRCSTWCYGCFLMAQNGNCLSQPACGCGNWDHHLQGISGTLLENQHCWTSKYTSPGAGNGPYAASNSTGMDGCRANHGCCVNHALFPSGGGGAPYGHASCCWGGWGASGLVKVTYWK